MLTIALAKGRLAEKTLERFTSIGFNFHETVLSGKSRKLILEDTNNQMKFFLSKSDDVPTYVEYGAADLGIAGKDRLLEDNRDLYEVYDFGFGKCQVAVAGVAGTDTKKNGLRVATKYPNVAAGYFEGRGVTIELIKLNGSIELAPMVGLADVIVDVVETGTTLKENNLVVLEEIMTTTARLIVNRVSMKLKHDRVSDMIRRLKDSDR